MKLKLLGLIVASVLANGCAGLSPQARNIEYSMSGEPKMECEFLGEVSSGIGLSLFSQKDVKNSLRNKTSKMGGNFLVVDDITSVSQFGNGGYGGFSGTGRAYHCPEQN